MVGRKGEGVRTRFEADDRVKAVLVVSETVSASGNGVGTTRIATTVTNSTSAAPADD